MMSRMATVRMAKAEKIIERPKNPPPLLEERPRRITMDQRTSDSSAHSPQQPGLHHPTYHTSPYLVQTGLCITQKYISYVAYHMERYTVHASCVCGKTYVHGPG